MYVTARVVKGGNVPARFRWAKKDLVKNIMMGKSSGKKPIERPRQNGVVFLSIVSASSGELRTKRFFPFILIDFIVLYVRNNKIMVIVSKKENVMSKKF